MSSKFANAVASESTSKLYLKSDFADTDFIFPNDDPIEKVPVHKCVLAAASPVFAAMFFGPLKETGPILMTDSSASVFKEFLQFFYLPEVTLTIENIEEIVRLADKYDVLNCFDTCAEFLKSNLTGENLVWSYQLAITLDNAQLKEFCEKLIQIFISDILKSEMFLRCEHEVVDHILKLNVLNCNEIELFNACIEWAKVSCQKNGLDETNSEMLKKQLGACFYSVRFGAMEGEEIGNILQNKTIEDMFTKDELTDIMRSKWAKPAKSDLFNHQQRKKPSSKWGTQAELVCKQKVLIDKNEIFRPTIQKQHSTWFSSNKFLLLVSISFQSFQTRKSRSYGSGNDYYQDVTVDFKVEIIERDENDFAMNALTKPIYTENNINSKFALYPKSAVVIRPHKLYEIRLHSKCDASIYFTPFEQGESEVKLNNKIKITFHENPSYSEYVPHMDGLVSTLTFNQIE